MIHMYVIFCRHFAVPYLSKNSSIVFIKYGQIEILKVAQEIIVM